ncbi:MAG: class I SAM-dependent methyltransferase [Candidatus Limnocylindrales bacterium]
MPFRRRFDCLWCGRTWGTRSDDDLEGWAALCPDCLARADDNGFLRGRVRIALRDRAAAAEAVARAARAAAPGDWEDWYLRRGRYARGPIRDGPWTMELDEVTRWVDGLGLTGTLVELGAGMGWWSALLAEKGELWVYDADGASLDAARTRLMAHGLLAHLHERDPMARPDKAVDVVFAAYFLGAASSDEALDARLSRITDWLKPGGSFVFVEAQGGTTVDGPGGRMRTFEAEALGGHLVAQGFGPVEIGRTPGAFVYGEALTPT